jgi:chemotaxis protein MotB
LVDDAEPILRVIAAALAGEPYDLEIAGHTDNLPIASAQFPSNWELSALRATAVVRVLADAGIASARLKAVGRADSQPVATNLTPEGRARNRRVELTVLAKLPPAAR